MVWDTASREKLYGIVIIRVQFIAQNLWMFSCIIYVHSSYYALAITVFVTHHKQKDLLFSKATHCRTIHRTRNLIIISIDLISFPIEMTSIFVSFLCFRYWWSRIIKEFRVNNVRKHKAFSRWSKTTSQPASCDGIHTRRKLFMGFGKFARRKSFGYIWKTHCHNI